MPELIGTTDMMGNPVFPEKTLSGNDYNIKSAILLNVPGGFVVLDLNPPQGFDQDAALRALFPPQAPAKVSKKAADAPEPPPTE